MKKITVVCLDNAKEQAAKALQSLGIVHVMDVVPPASQDLDALAKKQADLERILKAVPEDLVPAGQPSLPAQTIAEALENLDEQQKLRDDLQNVFKEQTLLEPWGSFDAAMLDDFRNRGLNVELCTSTPHAVQNIQLPEDSFLQIINQDKNNVYFIVVSRNSLADCNLPIATLPSCTDAKALADRRQKDDAQIDVLEKNFVKLAEQNAETWKKELERLQDEIALAKAECGMGESGMLAYLNGYVPEKKLETLRKTAQTNGWALLVDDVKEDDTNVPTLLNIPKKFSMAQQIFDFIGILPGYFETDVSIALFIFLTLFCGILIGDAGYGLLMTAAILYGFKKATTPNAKEGLKLLLCISLSILAYGWLSGNWFGIDPAVMPRFMKGLPWLYDDENSNHVKTLCFFIGAFHTSLARAWNAYNSQKSKRAVFGHLGWSIFLWGSFYLAKVLVVDGKGFDALPAPAIALFSIGFVLILAFGINWSNVGDVIYSPFTFINGFVDVLSYIRLFAVGLSGVYIAKCFNEMAIGVAKSGILGIIAMPIILLIGHGLNICMAFLSVLVHGIRLNTLEFAGHIGVSWSGKPYKPLAIHNS